MQTILVLDLFREALYMVMIITSLFIIPSLCVGLVVSVFQAATQINEQTLSFYPRLMMTFFAILSFGPWVLKTILEFMHRLIVNIPMYIG